jgi:hypothetical protein
MNRLPVLAKIKNIIGSERFALTAIFIFLLIHWWRLMHATPLGPPDFYEYYIYAGKLLAGDFQLRLIPPLFPLLLGAVGSLLEAGGLHPEPFLLAGRLISLTAGWGTVYFTYKLLKELTPGLALPAVICAAICPFFLKFLALPLTDLLYLLFVVMSFYYFYKNRWLASGVSVLAGLLSRFEGILLFFGGVINYLKLNLKRVIWLFLVALICLCDLFYLATRFAPRILNYIERILAQQSYLFFPENPLRLGRILYGNILFWVPQRFPGTIKFILFCLMLALFLVGLYKLFQTRWQWAAALLFYLVVFTLAKGYVVRVGVTRLHERRLLSVLFLFFIVSLVGLYAVLKFLWDHSSVRLLPVVRFMVLALLLLLAIFLPPGRWQTFLFMVPLLPAFLFWAKRLKLPKAERAAVFVLLLVICGSLYFGSSKQAYRFVLARPNRGGYAVAQWLNRDYRPGSGRLAVFSSMEMVRYYLERPVDMVTLDMRHLKQGEKEEPYWREFLLLLKGRQARYVMFDIYMEGKFEAGDRTVREMLRCEIGQDRYFEVVDYLKYKKRNVGAVLRPLYDRVDR